MRCPFVAARAVITVMIAVVAGACAATPTSPSATSSTAVLESPSASATVSPGPSTSLPAGAKLDGRIQVGDRRPTLVRCRRHVALGPPADEPGPRGPGDLRRHGTGPPALDGVRLRHDRRRFRLADGRRERRLSWAARGTRPRWPPEDRPGHPQGGHADPGRGGTGRRRRHPGLGVGGQRAQRVGPAHRSRDQQGCRDDPGWSDRTEWAADHDGRTWWRLGGHPAHG